MIRSYVSAIKSTLQDDNYQWDDSYVLISTLTRACKKINDTVKTCFPISCKLLELILFEIDRQYGGSQPYLSIMYKTVLLIGYYGLFRVGELAIGGQGDQHTIKAANVHIAVNKDKLLIILYSSKTHDKESRPQKVKITAVNSMKCVQKFYCPFKLIRIYMEQRGSYITDNEPLFIFRDGTGLSHNQVRNMIRHIINSLNLNGSLYDTHSLRMGRANDMLKFRYTIEQIKRAGRWKSNTVFRYVKN